MIIRGINNQGVLDKGNKPEGIVRQKSQSNIRFAGLGSALSSIAKSTNFQPPDITQRLSVWTIYGPQIAMAWKLHQHPYEVTGRCIVIWLGMLLTTFFGKNEKYGYTKWFNPLMRPKVHKNPTFLDKVFGRFQFDKNYLEFAHEAGINLRNLGIKADPKDKKAFAKALYDATAKAYWSSFDRNECDMMIAHLNKLKATKQVTAKEAAQLEKMLNRMPWGRYFCVAVTAVMMAAIVGIYLQKAVFKYLAPLDKRYTPKTKISAQHFLGKNGQFRPNADSSIRTLPGRYQVVLR